MSRRRLPPVDPAKEKMIEDIISNQEGPVTAPPVAISTKELSIDEEMKRGLFAVKKVMMSVLADAATGAPTRESVQNLKDCMMLLIDLKKYEKELLEDLSDEDLEKLVQDDNEQSS